MELSDCKTVADYRRWAKERGLMVSFKDVRDDWPSAKWPVSCEIDNISPHEAVVWAWGENKLQAVRMACGAVEAREE